MCDVYIYVYIYIYIYTPHIYIYILTHICVCVNICVCVYIYTHTHIHNGILFSHKKNEVIPFIMPFIATWMDVKIIILSEVSQKEKDKDHIISLIYGI